MKLISRGRAALREVHGLIANETPTLKGSNVLFVRPFQGPLHSKRSVRGLRAKPLAFGPWASRKAARLRSVGFAQSRSPSVRGLRAKPLAFGPWASRKAARLRSVGFAHSRSPSVRGLRAQPLAFGPWASRKAARLRSVGFAHSRSP